MNRIFQLRYLLKIRYLKKVSIYFPGFIFCFAIGSTVFIMTELSSNLLIDPFLLSLIIGIFYKNIKPNQIYFESGAKFISKHILEFSVMLLGATISIPSLLNTDLTLLFLVIFGVFGSIMIAYFVGHVLLRLNIKTSTLIGVGNGICGNSAVAVVAPIIGATSADISSVIGISAVLGATQILLLPILFNFMNLSEYDYGIMVGMSVYAVAQVYAASAIISITSLSIATVVKITRVVLLGPLVFIIQIIKYFYTNNNNTNILLSDTKLPVFNFLPWFVIGFIALLIFTGIGIITSEISQSIHLISKYFFIISMIAIGLSVNIEEILKIGPKVAATILSVIIFMLLITYIFVKNSL